MLNILKGYPILEKNVRIFLSSGKDLDGILTEINDNYIILRTATGSAIIKEAAICGIESLYLDKRVDSNLLNFEIDLKQTLRLSEFDKNNIMGSNDSAMNHLQEEKKSSFEQDIINNSSLEASNDTMEDETLTNILEQASIDLTNQVTDEEVIDDYSLQLDSESEVEQEEVEIDEALYDKVPWNETKVPEKNIFKGREELIDKLIRHYSSISRNKTYILYGLTRTGKSSILKHLSDKFKNTSVTIQGRKYKFIPFIWRFNEASAQSNAADMWYYLLKTCTIDQIYKLVTDKIVNVSAIPSEIINQTEKREKFAFKDFRRIIAHLKGRDLYPIFLIDEFTYYRELHRSKKLDSSFLSTLREFSIGGLSSFIFAGTYDLKELIKDPTYGITGQLANTIEEQVGPINEQASLELINAWKEKLSFDSKAIDHILFLSNQLPYFIQIICKNCGFYAIENNKWMMDFDDVEKVIQMMLNEKKKPSNSLIDALSPGLFNSNQVIPDDPKEIEVLLSSICYLSNENSKNGVLLTDIHKLWGKNQIANHKYLISESIEKLKTRGVLIDIDSKGERYRIGVDLFRRWWRNGHPNIEHEISFLNTMK